MWNIKNINLKKIILTVLLLLWLVVGGWSIAGSKQAGAVALGTIFGKTVAGKSFDEVNTFIEAYGKFGVCYLTKDEKEALVTNMAAAIGLAGPYHITTENADDGSVTVLTKDSLNGRVVIKALTKEKRQSDGSIMSIQHVYLGITIYNNVDCAGDYKELVEGMFDAMGIDGKVNLNLVGSVAGMLNREEKNSVADSLLEQLKAKVVAESREGEIFTIYAYSGGIKNYIVIGQNKINVNIAISYDDVKDCTNIFVSSPVNSLDY